MSLTPNVKIAVGIPPQREGWKSFQFNILNFAAIDATKGDWCDTPEFSCNGHRWQLQIYPGGHYVARDGNISIFLAHRSKGGISATFDLKALNKFGGVNFNSNQPTTFYPPDGTHARGWPNFIRRSDTLDLSQNILDDDGTLAIVFSMKEEPPALKKFIPKNPCQNMLQKKFLDEETSDVCFEVSSSDSKNDGSKKSKASDLFHAHRSILEICAPMLAALFAPRKDDESAIASITDVEPDIFRHLLFYVYGGSVPEEVLKQNAKELSI